MAVVLRRGVVRHRHADHVLESARSELSEPVRVEHACVRRQNYLRAAQHQDTRRFGELAVVADHAADFHFALLGVQSAHGKIVAGRKLALRIELARVNLRVRQNNLAASVND